MKIIFGLGNPGKKYEFTRHNTGFLMLDKIRSVWNFPAFKFEKKFNAEISKNEEIILCKPQTFMNLSGETVRSILDFYKLSAQDLLVVHDDIDIELGKTRIAEDSSSAGHNGVQDIIEKLGTQKFKRIRVGIGKPSEEKETCPVPAHDFVLGKFLPEETEVIGNVFGNVLKETEDFLRR